MFIAGTEQAKIVIAEPEALRIALYVRDVAGLQPVTDPMIPPLHPPADVWPVWSRRPVEVTESGSVRLLRGRELDLRWPPRNGRGGGSTHWTSAPAPWTT